MFISSVWRHNQFCRCHPLNGDEGTITEYGHFRVISRFGKMCLRWILTFVLCIDFFYPQCLTESELSTAIESSTA